MPLIVWGLVALSASCGAKRSAEKQDAGPTLETALQEHAFGEITARGQLPRGWRADAQGRLAAKAPVADLDVVLMSIDVEAVAGTSVVALELEMQRRKAMAVQAFGGEKTELVADLEEISPGIWTMATRVREGSYPGAWSRSAIVFHLPPEPGTMYVCTGEARLDRAEYWQALRDLCAGLVFSR